MLYLVSFQDIDRNISFKMIVVEPCFHQEYFFMNYERTNDFLNPPSNTFITASLVDVPHCEYIHHFTFLDTMLILYAVLNFGILCSVVFTAYCVYSPMMKSIQTRRYPDEEPKPTLYEEKYNLKNSSNDNQNPNPNSYVIEFTPDGMVIMRYDENDEGFIYWSDKSISYRYLEVVGRKYVHMNCCKHLFIYEEESDTENEEEEEEEETQPEDDETEEIKEEQQQKENDDDDDDDDVFVKRKQPETNAPTSTGNSIHVERNRASKDIEKNKYIHRGKIRDFNMTKDKVEANKEKDTITFSSFKQMLFGSSSRQ